MKRVYVYVLIFLGNFMLAQRGQSSFNWLDSLGVSSWGPGKVYYIAQVTTILNSRSYHKKFGRILLLLKTKVDGEGGNYYTIAYSPGPSDDPLFIVFKDYTDSLKNIGVIGCDRLFIPGNNFIYSQSRTDQMFKKRRKFAISRGQLFEVTQPYYYVGISTKTNKPIQIYSDIDLTLPLASLPKGNEVEILLNKDDKYLVKTPFGLVGWIKIPITPKTVFDDLFFKGD